MLESQGMILDSPYCTVDARIFLVLGCKDNTIVWAYPVMGLGFGCLISIVSGLQLGSVCALKLKVTPRMSASCSPWFAIYVRSACIFLSRKLFPFTSPVSNANFRRSDVGCQLFIWKPWNYPYHVSKHTKLVLVLKKKVSPSKDCGFLIPLRMWPMTVRIPRLTYSFQGPLITT